MPEKGKNKTDMHIRIEEVDALKEKLDNYFQRLLKAKHFKHALASVESMDGSFKWVGASGITEPAGATITSETPFCIASVTKLFIAVVIFRLYEQGHLALDDHLADYLPQNLINRLHCTEDGTDQTSRITIHHLLGHSSGLPDYMEIKTGDGKSLVDRVLEEGDMSWSIEDIIGIVRDANKPLFPPQTLDVAGIKVRYSDTNYQLLIAIIEKITGKPIPEAFEEMIFKPLNLKETYHPAGLLPKGLPLATSFYYGDRALDIPKAMNSFNDIYSTLADLTVFMRALIRSEIFESPEIFELMTANWNRFGFMISPVAPGWPIEYSLGIMRFRIPRLFSPFKAVPELIGHTGASGSWLFYCSPLKLILAGTVDQIGAGAAPFRFSPGLLNIIEKHIGR